MRFVQSAATQPGAITAGSLDIGTFNAPLLLLANEGGLDLRIVAGGTSEQGKDKEMGRVMAREHSGIKSARDFRGRRIGLRGRARNRRQQRRNGKVDRSRAPHLPPNGFASLALGRSTRCAATPAGSRGTPKRGKPWLRDHSRLFGAGFRD
jgi:hypothetical protein